MLDLGALVCTGRSPACDALPAGGGRPVRVERPPVIPTPTRRPAPSRRQSTFAGSDRQGRGRLVDRPPSGSRRPGPAGRRRRLAGDPARAARVAAGLVADGLAVDSGGSLALP